MEASLWPDRQRWTPTSEADITDAIDAGLIAEWHYIDVKREVGDNANKRKETARDLASFAIDSGALLIGVDEDKDSRTFSAAPQPLRGLAERIEQVAGSAIEPPLNVTCIEIPCEGNSTHGYVLVGIPPSAFAPHMVDGRYYARGDKTKRVLTDADVTRMHLSRESLESRIDRALDYEASHDPVRADDRRLGHMYLIAEPIGAPRNLAKSLVRGGDANALARIVLSGPAPGSHAGASFEVPTPADYARDVTPRSRGIAFHSHRINAAGRMAENYPGGESIDDGLLLEIAVREDGGIRVLVGRFTAEHSSRSGVISQSHKIMDSLAISYARRLVEWAVGIGNATGWRGTWALGFHGDRARGLSSQQILEFGTAFPVTFDEDEYREITTASHLEMEQYPGRVTERLVGRLTQALNSYNRLHVRFRDEPTDAVP